MASDIIGLEFPDGRAWYLHRENCINESWRVLCGMVLSQ